MTLTLDPNDPRSPSLQVADALRRGIQSGEYSPGQRLPSVSELTSQFGVAPGTVQSALRALRHEGLIVTWQGRGTYVRTVEPSEAQQPDLDTVMRQLDQMAASVRRLTERVADLEEWTRTQTPQSDTA